jgi:hypothetical protein
MTSALKIKYKKTLSPALAMLHGIVPLDGFHCSLCLPAR